MAARADERTRKRLLEMPGVTTLRRQADGTTQAFDLVYVRSGPRGETPVVVLPGGPGLASVMPYIGFRARAQRAGLDVVMMEHRGVGLSRADTDGEDLTFDAMSVPLVVDDLAAVLDDAGIDKAIIYGSSYGSYVAQAFGATYPSRVAGMVLDSPVLGADDHVEVREHARSVLWEGTEETADIAKGLRALVRSGRATQDQVDEVARITYEYGGPRLLRRLAAQQLAGRADRTWRWLASLGDSETDTPVPYIMEFDLAGAIAFRELRYASERDGGPFDRPARFTEVAKRFPPFSGEHFDMLGELPSFDWPLVVLRGERDLRTAPSTAERIASTAPRGVEATLPKTGHSVLDVHPVAARTVMQRIREGKHEELAGAGEELAALPKHGSSRHLATIIRTRLGLERTPFRRGPVRPQL